jgi:hypothetical protein
MKNLFLSIAAVLFCVVTVEAQKHPGQKNIKNQTGVEQRKHAKAKLAHHIGLNDEQKKQAQTINKSYHEKVEQLKSNDKLTMGEYKKQMASLQKERKTQMDALLTAEQKNKIVEAKKRGDENRQVHAVAQLERMKIRLELKDEQITKVKKVHDQMVAKAKAIRENDELTMEDKKSKMMQLGKDRREAILAILTPEQQEKMKQTGKRKQEAK